MIRITRAACFLLAAMLTGCGQGSLTSNPGTPPPHGGNLVKLHSGQGYVEVVKKAVASGKEPTSGEATFYFFKDMTVPYSPAPSSGTLTVGKKKVTLKSEGDALVTPSGPPLFAKGDVDGVLSVELDGKSINIPLGIR
ncbi:MAG: hypothetical protein WB773_18545 [Isosphaeraceae bacterium]|jgi:hypothetical protein